MWQVIGHAKPVSLLKRSLEIGNLAHAYLLLGPQHVGRMTLALNLAQALNCTADEPPCGQCDSCQKIGLAKHADIQIIGLRAGGESAEAKLRTEIGIDQIRELQHSAFLPPFEGKCRVFIIEGAELLSTEAANCLLKTLEEPAEKVVFVLLATNEQLLPATVVSRCQRLELRPLPAGEIEAALISHYDVELPRARLLARLAHGCPGWAILATTDDNLLKWRAETIERLLDISTADYDQRFSYAAQLATQFGQNKKMVRQVLDLWLYWWRDLLLSKIGSSDSIINVDHETGLARMAQDYRLAHIKSVIDDIKEAKEQLGLNANPQLVLEVLMLNIPKREAVKHG
ncbi:MAG: DNA polymerase III subunit delta' C-terminal domain-containing protein [Chloroflexota bacterium]